MSDNNDEERVLSTAEKMQAMRDERQSHEEKIIENIQAFKGALNAVAATPDGHLVLKTLIKACGVFAVKPNRDGMALVGDKALRDLYLSLFRPHLDANIRQELEL